MLIIIGFPIALIIARAFEATPEGIKRTEAADAAGQRSRGGPWIYIVLIGDFGFNTAGEILDVPARVERVQIESLSPKVLIKSRRSCSFSKMMHYRGG
jgi:hypothetical protein